MQDKIKPMTPSEAEAFKEQVRKQMKNDRLNLLELNLRVNLKLKQQYEIRIEVIKELINEKSGIDFKTRQYHDENS